MSAGWPLLIDGSWPPEQHAVTARAQAQLLLKARRGERLEEGHPCDVTDTKKHGPSTRMQSGPQYRSEPGKKKAKGLVEAPPTK